MALKETEDSHMFERSLKPKTGASLERENELGQASKTS